MNTLQLKKKISATIMAFGAAAALAACGSSEEETTTETTANESADTAAQDAGSEEAPASEMPTAAELNEVLSKATDPNVPVEEKTQTVQGSETAPELFEVMTASKAESGATFEVVDPVLPGYSPDSVLTTVNFSTPDQPAQTAEGVEFVFDDGNWKLQQGWACTLITNSVTPDQVPPMCQEAGDAGEVTPAEGEAPAEAPAQ